MRSNEDQAKLDKAADEREIANLRASVASVHALADSLEHQADLYADEVRSQGGAVETNCENCQKYRDQARQLREALFRAQEGAVVESVWSPLPPEVVTDLGPVQS